MQVNLSASIARFMALLAMSLSAAAAAKPRVVILATGGTIAGSAESQTQAGYASGQVGVDLLLETDDPSRIQALFDRY